MIPHALLKDGICHQPSFFIIAGSFDDLDAVALIVRGPDLFGQLHLVVADDLIGSFHDYLGASVVLFQAEGLHFRKVLFKVQDVLDVGTAKGVDALGIIAHHTDVLVYICQSFDDGILQEVGILELVYEHVFETVLVFVQHIGMVFQQLVGLQQQIIEIHGTGTEASLGIFLIDVADLRPAVGFILARQFRMLAVLLVVDEVVLGQRDPVMH